jgi:hypothetical protein
MYITFEEIKSAGEMVIARFNKDFEANLAFNAESVEWVEGYIQRNREVLSKEYRISWSISFGYLLGEAIISAYGGAWEYDEILDEWMIDLGQPVGSANPIGKTYKFLSSPDESILSFFKVIGLAKAKGGFTKVNDP